MSADGSSLHRPPHEAPSPDRDRRGGFASPLADRERASSAIDSERRFASDRTMGVAFTLMLLVPLVTSTVILLAVSPRAQTLGWMALALLGVLGLLRIIVGLIWSPWASRWPATDPATPLRWSAMESARLGRIGGLNHCLWVAADATHVHLRLMAPFHLCDRRTISIPRAAIESPRRGRIFRQHTSARVAGRSIMLPTWAVEERPVRG